MEEIVNRVKAGDREAYERIVWECSPRIHAYFAARLCDVQAVEDLAQETFIAAYQNLHRFRGESAFTTWLTGIARNKLMDHLRRKGSRANAVERLRGELLAMTMDQVDSFDWEEQARAIAKMKSCLLNLSPGIQDLVKSHYLLGEPIRSLAERLSRTIASVHSTLFRARRQLRLCMLSESES